MHVSEVSPCLPSAVGVVDEDGAVGDGAVPRDLQAVDVAQVDGEVDEEASLEICEMKGGSWSKGHIGYSDSIGNLESVTVSKRLLTVSLLCHCNWCHSKRYILYLFIFPFMRLN